MTRIKICGITNSDDALLAVESGADALGFIAVPESPRFVTGEAFLQIMEHPALWGTPFVSTVAVARRMEDVESRYATQYVQIYEGEITSPGRTFRVFRIHAERDLEAMAAYPFGSVAAFLLDTYHKDKLGGSGETFNWDLALEAKARFGLPIILAGGLTPENVEEAVRRVRPYAVDVSSGVEAEPGRKDPNKVRAFCRAVRRADAALDF